jgi:hypothetical protein
MRPAKTGPAQLFRAAAYETWALDTERINSTGWSRLVFEFKIFGTDSSRRDAPSVWERFQTDAVVRASSQATLVIIARAAA